MTRPKLTVLVTTFNEADQIVECLDSVAWADEVYLLDSHSTDGTVELARRHPSGVRLEQREYLGAAAQKNYGIDNASHDWILVVDADERVTPELHREIERVLERPACWAYWIGRRNFMLGKPVRFSGLQRDGVRRLFHRAHARYPNRRVHVDLAVDGPVGRLDAKLDHNYVRSIEHMREKMTRYGVWAATQLYLDGERGAWWKILLHPLFRGVRDYLFNLGILDGSRGMIIVALHCWYTFWKYAKLWEFDQARRRGEEPQLAPIERNPERFTMPWELTERPSN